MKTILVDLPTEYGFAREIFRGAAAAILSHPGWSLLPTNNYAYFVGRGMRTEGAIGFYSNADQVRRVTAVADVCINVSNFKPPLASVLSVINDDRAIGALAARHYLERGYRRIYFMIWGTGGQLGRERWEGLRDTAAAGGAEPVLFHGGTTEELVAFLGTLERPAAIALCADSLITFVLRELHQLGWSVPTDAAILGVDNDRLLTELTSPPVSSIRPAAARIGRTAVEWIIKRRRPGAVLRVPPEGIEQRLSTDGYAVADPRLRKALGILDASFSGDLDIPTLARKAGVSRRHLTQLFAEHLGTSPSRWRENRRLREAKSLLAATSLPLDEVAVRCGYANAVSFWRAFRRAEHMAPGEYRASFAASPKL